MKLCFLAGANSIHSDRWVRFFAARGHDVSWISLVPNQFEPIPGVRMHEFDTGHRPLAVLRSIPAIRRIVRAEAPDLLHVHSVGSYGLAGQFAGARRIVATPWGSDVVFGKHSPAKRPFIIRVLRQARLITCDAEYMRDEIAGLGVDAGKVELVNFGIDTDRFRPLERDPSPRHALGLGDAPTVVSLRNFEPVYDLPALIRAIPLVLQRCPEARFVLAGRGSQLAALKALARELGVADQVRFVGFIANEQLPAYLNAMDVYVSTSLSDAGIAASTAEAMACGLPAVITASAENDRWIQDGENGFLVPVSDPDALAAKLADLLLAPELRARLGAAGRRTIQARNSYRVEMERMEALYRGLLE